MTEKNADKQVLPRWLKQQQQQSWQIEILIASGLIYFLYNLPSYLVNTLIDIQESSIPRAEEVILFFGGYIFSRALLIGFILTLFLRSLWLAFLGVNYAFPRGVNERRLSYSEYFIRKLHRSKSTAERIVTLEKICSLTFSVTIMVTLLTAGMFIALTILFYGIFYIAPSLYPHFTPTVGIIFLLLFFLMLLGVFDWIVFGWLKRHPAASKIYYPVHKLFQWLSLSFLYHQEFLTFISNVRRWKAYGLFLLFVLIAFFVSMAELADEFGNLASFTLFSTEERELVKLPSLLQIRQSNYENMLGDDSRIISASIQSDIVSDNYLKVFVVYLKLYDATLDSLLRKNNVQLSLRQKTMRNFMKNDSLLQRALDEFFQIKIDGRPVSHNDWHLHKHHITGETGFLTFVPLRDYAGGRHLLTVEHLSLAEGRPQWRQKVRIVFYKN